MPLVQIKQMDERVATSGLHFGADPRVPKLEPGDRVFIDDGPEFEALWATGKLELARGGPTRPYRFDDEHEARYCRPSYRPTDESDRQRMEAARAAVAARLAKAHKPKAEPAAEEQDDAPESEQAMSRRERRRARAAEVTGAQVST